MSNILTGHKEKKYLVCHNDDKIYHICEVEINQQCISGQPIMNVYGNKIDMLAPLKIKAQTDISLANIVDKYENPETPISFEGV